MKGKFVQFVAGIIAGAVLVPTTHAAVQQLAATSSAQKFYVDGTPVQLEAYAINGSNYVKLRDIGEAVGFHVSYDGSTNSVYIGERPAAVQNTGTGYLTNGQPVTEENVLALLRQIERDWPTGTIWGTNKTPGTHKNEVPSTASGTIMRGYHVSNTYACGAYASMVSSLIFGDTANPGRRLDDLSQIRPGDIIFKVRNENNSIWHVIVALESPSDINAFRFTDGNVGGTIQWPDSESPYSNTDNLDCYRGEHKDYHLEVWTRYPESAPYTGASVGAWFTPNQKQEAMKCT